MKDNLEKAFKNSLEEYEVPYDPKAWDAVNAKLNAKSTGGTSVLSNALKWGLATALLGIVATASYFLWYNNEAEVNRPSATVNQKEQEPIPIVQKTEKTKEKETAKQEEKEELTPQQSQEVNKNDLPIAIEEKQTPKPSKDENGAKTSTGTASVIEKTDKEQIGTTATKDEPIPTQNSPVENSNNYRSGVLSSTVICANDIVTIHNPSKDEIVRFKHQNRWVKLNANKKYTFTPTSSMVINFVNNKNELIEAKYIKVNELPTPSFDFDANIYEKGLPVVKAKADGDYKSYTWTFDQTAKRTGAKVNHHFFDKGKYNITLNVEDANGCKAKKSKTVRIRDKYNLMAVDAFKPNGSDVRNKTFMPYSLTERDVRFELTIIDPIDNGVVFSSNDADNPWDGKDRRTGKMTTSNKTFIWKVQILNPVLNERPIYAGTIVHN